MAIARGAGTEIIRTVHLEEVDLTVSDLIVGVQHHIYTVLSVIFYAASLSAEGNYVRMKILGYDSKEGTTNITHHIFKQDMNQGATFVWNDKFSFNGYEPTDFAGPMDDATKQDAIADQGSSVAQRLQVWTENAADNVHVTCTYIDQNNA